MKIEEYLRYSEEQILKDPKDSDYPEAYHKYLKINHTRFNRILQTIKIHEPLERAIMQLKTPLRWIIITEPWCGDAAQSVPVIIKAASLNDSIQIELVLRDQNIELMNEYLTNGSKSIPILVMRDIDGNDLAVWGPRPKEAQDLVVQLKQTPDVSKEEAMELVQRWYIQNKSAAVQDELLAIMHNLLKKYHE